MENGLKKGEVVIVNHRRLIWGWLSYRNEDIGYIKDIKDYGYEYKIARVFLFRTQKVESVPCCFLLRLEEWK